MNILTMGYGFSGTGKNNDIRILRIAAAVAVVYGMYAFVKRGIGNYMLLKGTLCAFWIIMSLYSFSCWII